MDDNVKKIYSQFIVAPTGYIVSPMELKLFQTLSLYLIVDRSEGFVNRIKINGMVNNYLSSCNV